MAKALAVKTKIKAGVFLSVTLAGGPGNGPAEKAAVSSN